MAMARYIYLAGAGAILLVAAATAKRSPGRNSRTERDRIPPEAQTEIRFVELEIDRIEAETLSRAQSATLDRFQQITLLGKLIFYDQQLSVKKNESCSFCHMPETGFSGPVSALNQTTAAYPGSIRTRFSARRPQSHTYASYSPVLHYNVEQHDFVGGQFWDMRATGLRLDSALAEQAQGPPLNPLEMGLIDPACMVYRVSQRPYRAMAERIWAPKGSRSGGPRIPNRCATVLVRHRIRTSCRFISAQSTGELHRRRSIRLRRPSQPLKVRLRWPRSLRSSTMS